ncbi:MAG: response regulator transcription factor [Planctomycetaceae bacterium]|nr:response regulator transcription factor [Planctomycetaceae bacterium]
MSISVLIVDDHEVVRLGLQTQLAEPDIEVVGQAQDAKAAVALATQVRPQIVLLDVRMPDTDGLDLLEELRTIVPDSRVIILSAYDNPTYVARAITLGASDYVLKGSGKAELLASIRAVASGDRARQSALVRRIEAVLKSTSEAPVSGAALTTRESQVLRHLALGLSNKDIGRSLSISIETVKEHVQNVLRKMGVIDRTQAAVEAVRQGVV